MAKIIIYPNNQVEIDGCESSISLDELGVEFIRVNPLRTYSECEKFNRNGDEYIVFYTAQRGIQMKKRVNNPFKSLIIKRTKI